MQLGAVNAYLLRGPDGLILIDAGWPNRADAIFAAVQKAGQDTGQIRHLVLTHAHIDHSGGAAEVIIRTGARTYAHTGDIALMTQGQAEYTGTTITPGVIPRLVYLAFIKRGGSAYPPFAIDHILVDGQTLPMAPDVDVIHTPGHTAGHIALLLRKEGLLIAGDLCSNVVGLDYSILNQDRALAQKSILRVAEYSFDQAVFGHGRPLMKNANLQLKHRFSKSCLR